MRTAQVSAETINPAHPGSKFSGGNLETLSDKPGNPVQQALKDFHEKYLFRQFDEGGYLQ